MKSLLIASIFALSLSVPASAQEYQGCWMIDGARRLIRLPELCPQPQPIPTATAAQSQSAIPPLPPDAVDRVAAFYAGRYCDQRETGVVSREDARSDAWDKTFAMMEQLYGVDQALSFVRSSQDALLDAAERSISLQCPTS